MPFLGALSVTIMPASALDRGIHVKFNLVQRPQREELKSTLQFGLTLLYGVLQIILP